MPSLKALSKHHDSFEAEIGRSLESLGFMVDHATYHVTYRPRVKTRLAEMSHPTALYLRGRADKIAIHTIFDYGFEWECKNHNSSRLHDACIEALPLAHHLCHAGYYAHCLYAYRNPDRHPDVGFWVQDLPPLRELFIPDRWDQDHVNFFHHVFRAAFPSVPVRVGHPTRGSRDPFAVIAEATVRALPSWQRLAEAALVRQSFRAQAAGISVPPLPPPRPPHLFPAPDPPPVQQLLPF
jgi:hypothetical protein